MLDLLKKLFVIPDAAQSQPAMSIDLATAVLLVEVAGADYQRDESEARVIRELLLAHLSIAAEQVDELIRHAHREANQLVSLQHLTRLMNEQLDEPGKVRVIELMWKVAYADGEKHHYEEHLLRQVADLLYVPHGEFIQARDRAAASAGV